MKNTIKKIKNDFNKYSKYVSKGGVVMFDDQDYPGIGGYIATIGKKKEYTAFTISDSKKNKQILVKG